MQDNRDDRGQSRMRTQQYRDRRGNPVDARGDPLNCPFGNRLCEYGVRGALVGSAGTTIPLPANWGGSQFRAGYVVTAGWRDGANGASSDPDHVVHHAG
ncbi:hypothetical protein AAFF_G00011640 [Aldrovandia affinis]|uniref:Uncharacterized protein n=1 Tax=Aldrovandia affinis TaxID=143900 RepID=A0AAD7R2P2_9TELE|nr:hypothetical protein AAFF_G00011640 [Aldrovandia affinis]